MHTASYLITRLKPDVIGERADRVFQLLPNRIKNLVIVNGNLSDFEMIQACVKVAEKYSDNILVIPPLLARMTYALKDIAKLHDPPLNERILVVTINNSFNDFVILQRNQNFELEIIHRSFCKSENEIMKEFPQIYQEFFPDATVILFQKEYSEFVEKIQNVFNPKNLFSRFYKRWDYLLMSGGLMRAPNSDDREFDKRYWIPNFSMGIETIIYSGRKIILPEGTKIPCKFYGINNRTPQSIKLWYSAEYYQLYENLVYGRKEASKKSIYLTGSSDQVIGYYDDRGVPYISSIIKQQTVINEEKEAFNRVNQTLSLQTMSTTESKDDKAICEPTTKSDAPSISKDSLNNEHMEAFRPKSRTQRRRERKIKNGKKFNPTFIFEEDFFGAEIFQDDVTQKVKDSAGNERIPLYLSMADGIPEIGEKARNDYHKFPQYVIYDVFKVIGKPLNEIKIDPKWGFKVIENNGNICFQIETPAGPRLIPQEIVISAFMKSAKLKVESKMGNEKQINKILLSTTLKLSKPQKVIFEKAAEKNNLEILYFIVALTESE
uniref:Uncharacterized protein n=1 Tax=Panagrolaimus sp. PS1159 TaxID=55785 RepID=A0AC35FNW7_9BILA